MDSTARMPLAVGALAALLAQGVPDAVGAGTSPPTPARAAPLATDLDPAIERIVALRVASRQLDAAAAPVAREQLQLQFLAMSPEARAGVLVVAQQAAGDLRALDVLAAMKGAIADAARRQAAEARDARIAAVGGSKQAAGGMLQKLGTDGDLVFVATAGPCRVADTRLGHYADWPGMIGGLTARQIWAYSVYSGFAEAPRISSLITSENPMMALSGVRSSWLIAARKAALARLADSAWSFASRSSLSMRLARSMNRMR